MTGDLKLLPTSRSQAREAGEPHFFTGLECLRGHLTYRVTSSGVCSQCARENALKRYYANPEKQREAERKWYHANLEKRREATREKARRRRAREKAEQHHREAA